MMYKGLMFLGCCLLSLGGYSQENGSENEEEQEESNHKVAVVIGVTHIPSAFEEGKENEAVFVPTIGVDYFYQFKKGWKIGAVFDLELNNYLVDFNREELEREKALVTGVLVGYEFANRWSLMLGPGVEFEENKNLFILRASVEREFELDEQWGLFPSVNFDFKEEYTTWSINIGISRKF